MVTVLDVVAFGSLIAAWLVLNMMAGVLARKLSTLYDYQNDLEWQMLPMYAVGFGLFALVIVAFLCLGFRSNLYWHQTHPCDECPQETKAECTALCEQERRYEVSQKAKGRHGQG
jgi:hypothetical protein